MPNKLKIKAGNISHLTDARYFAAYGMEWMGFNFKANDVNKIDIETAKTIIDWIEGPQIIAEFDHLDLDYIFQTCHQLQINNIQLPIEYFTTELKDYEVFWKGNATHLNKMEVTPKNILIENLGETIETQNILQKNENTIISLNENFELSKSIIQLPTLKAIEICGSSEDATGLKAFDAINDLFEWLEDEGRL